MEPILIGNSRWKNGLLLLVSLGFVVAQLSLLSDPNFKELRWEMYGVVVFFGCCAAFFIWQLFDSRPRLKIDDAGINDRTLGVGVIPWVEITDAYVKSIKGNDFVCLIVRDPTIWTSKFSPVQKRLISVNRSMGFQELNINLSGIKANTSQIHELILKMSAAARN